MELLTGLNDFEREVLASLPIEPTGLSMAELADGLLGNRGPTARGRVRQALIIISSALGGLYVGRGDDDFGSFNVPFYGVRRRDMEKVKAYLT